MDAVAEPILQTRPNGKRHANPACSSWSGEGQHAYINRKQALTHCHDLQLTTD